MLELLKELDFTDGEIKVYEALARLGKTSTGQIMEKADISSSKIYLILDRLVKKGLVSYVIEDNVKKFQITPPSSVKEYIDKQKQKFIDLEESSNSFISEIEKLNKYNEIETAQIYKGFRGVEVAFTKLIDEMDEKDNSLFFSRSEDEFEEKVIDFFDKIKEKRLKKKISSLGIVHPSLKIHFKKMIADKYWKVHFSNFLPPTPLTIGKNSVLITLWGKEPICFEIRSKRMVDDYRKYFYEIWESSKGP